jgi:hypothetical protein
MTTLSEKISKHYCELKYDDIPEDKRNAIKWLTLDYLGVACRGSETSSGRIA